ncbi:MAG: hypothetical protein ACRDZ5_01200 [Acidimicrobiales bacterium]
MSRPSVALVAIELLAGSVWVGSLACLAIVSAAARRALDGPSRVALFRAIGRRYGLVGTGSLLVAIGVGLALSWPPSSWSGTIDAAVALAGVLVVASLAGMAQARAMTRLRRSSMTTPRDSALMGALRRGRILAGGLRGTMAVVSVVIVVLAAEAISH